MGLHIAVVGNGRIGRPTAYTRAAIVDLLYDGAIAAKKIIDEYEPVVSREGYMDYWNDILK